MYENDEHARGHEYSGEFAEGFDRQLRESARAMRAQMQPDDEVLARTLAAASQAAAEGDAVKPASETKCVDGQAKSDCAKTSVSANLSEAKDLSQASYETLPVADPLPTAQDDSTGEVSRSLPSAPTGRPAYLAPVTQTQSQEHPVTKQSQRRKNRVIGIMAAAAATVLVAVGGITLFSTLTQAPLSSENNPALGTDASLETGIITLGTYDELYNSLKTQAFDIIDIGSSLQEESVAPTTSAPSADAAGSSAGDMAAAAAPEASAAAPTNDIAGGAYSETNTQVAGVDEADIVKTDGRYIYSLYGNEIIITEANGSDTEVVARLYEEAGYVHDLYVSQNRLVVLSSGIVGALSYYGETTTLASIYDISDPSNPVLLNTFGQDGSLNTTRLVDGILHMVSVYWVYGDNANQENPQTYVPVIYEGTEVGDLGGIPDTAEPLAIDDIFIMPEYSGAQYTVIATLDIESAQRVDEVSFLGDTSTVYMNEKNLFLAATDYGYAEIVPFAETAPSTEDTSVMAPPVPTTRIARIALEGGVLTFAASTKIHGTLLNQFSLDEYAGFLRLATTVTETGDTQDSSAQGTNTPGMWGALITTNSLLVLDGDLNVVGSIEDMAPGERIYSARFSGEVGYMVTFRQTDPLFSLDLSDPQNPKVMDALKIPGFSQYLHPYAEGRLLGLGQNTSSDGSLTGNLKLSMFDVSDPFDISEAHKQLVEAYYSDALYNHKALLIDAEQDIIGFETEMQAIEPGPEEMLRYVTVSVYCIYGYDSSTGFYERAAIVLPEPYENTRALYIDEYLYIVNGESIGVFTLDTLQEVAWITM